MYKEIILIITLTILILYCSEEKRQPKIKFKTAYTNVIALYARSKPSLKSKKINLLPFGTKIKVRKTKFTSVYQGHKAHWYYEHYTKGYVFGKYIQKTLPKKNIEFKMNLNATNGGFSAFVSSDEKIFLSKNKFKYFIKEHISVKAINKYIYKGIYRLKGSKIILQSSYTYKKAKINPTSSTGSKTKISSPKKNKLNLIFINYIPGFLKERDNKVLNKNKYFLDRKYKSFISSKHLAIEKRGTDARITRYGYFHY